jgi:hypothetical protein
LFHPIPRERGLSRDSGASPEATGSGGSSPRARPPSVAERVNHRGSPDALAAGPAPKLPPGGAAQPELTPSGRGGAAPPPAELSAARPRRTPGQRAVGGWARGGGERALGEGREPAAVRWHRGDEEDAREQGAEEEGEEEEQEEEGSEDEEEAEAQGERPAAAAAEEDLDALLASAAAQVGRRKLRLWERPAGTGRKLRDPSHQARH